MIMEDDWLPNDDDDDDDVVLMRAMGRGRPKRRRRDEKTRRRNGDVFVLFSLLLLRRRRRRRRLPRGDDAEALFFCVVVDCNSTGRGDRTNRRQNRFFAERKTSSSSLEIRFADATLNVDSNNERRRRDLRRHFFRRGERATTATPCIYDDAETKVNRKGKNNVYTQRLRSLLQSSSSSSSAEEVEIIEHNRQTTTCTWTNITSRTFFGAVSTFRDVKQSAMVRIPVRRFYA